MGLALIPCKELILSLNQPQKLACRVIVQVHIRSPYFHFITDVGLLTQGHQKGAASTSHFHSLKFRYTTSPHLFEGDAEIAFARVRSKVKVPLYGCDCYAYALLASGFVDLVIESGLKPYDFLSLVPVIEGAGGTITDWKGQQFSWKASAGTPATSFNVVAAGDEQVHQQALDALQWH